MLIRITLLAAIVSLQFCCGGKADYSTAISNFTAENTRIAGANDSLYALLQGKLENETSYRAAAQWLPRALFCKSLGDRLYATVAVPAGEKLAPGAIIEGLTRYKQDMLTVDPEITGEIQQDLKWVDRCKEILENPQTSYDDVPPASSTFRTAYLAEMLKYHIRETENKMLLFCNKKA